MTSRRQCPTVIRLILRMKPGMEPRTAKKPARQIWRIPAAVVRLCRLTDIWCYNTKPTWHWMHLLLFYTRTVSVQRHIASIPVLTWFSEYFACLCLCIASLKLVTFTSMLCYVTLKSSGSRWRSVGFTPSSFLTSPWYPLPSLEGPLSSDC